jgi:uncharacterized membrane protein
MRFVFLAALALFVSSGACAQEYYADVTVDVDASGHAALASRTNHPLLSQGGSNTFTSKRGNIWLFNLTLPGEDIFSDYVYAVNLPPGASVNYVKASGQFRIATSGGRISVRGSGEDEDVSVVIQYRLAEEKTDFSPYILGAVILVFATVAYLVLRRRRLQAAPKQGDDAVLTDRQREIMRIVREAGQPVNQAAVCERLGLPKSSVSRNVDTLAGLGLLRKTRNGMSTMLSLPPGD